MTESTADPPFGRISTNGNDTSFTALCDGLVISHDYDWSNLLIVSAVGPQTVVKAITAVLHSTRFVTLSAKDCGDCCPYYGQRVRNLRTEVDYGYRVSRTRLGFDSWHLLAINEDPGLIPVYSQRSLLDKLKSHRFTTPILDGWIGYLTAELKERGHFKTLPSFGCRAGFLTLNDNQLDAIVSEGLRDGKIHITKEAAHA